MIPDLRLAITPRGTYVHAALPREQARGRTLCGRRYGDASGTWEWEAFDDCWHCSRCWHAAEKLRAPALVDGDASR